MLYMNTDAAVCAELCVQLYMVHTVPMTFDERI